MYEEFFGFSGSPFRLAPDPKFFFGSKSHNKAMAYLHYGLRQAEGFIVITGEIGAGKSVLIGHLLDQLDRSNVVAANLVTPNLAPEDLLSHILSAFRIEAAGAGKAAEIEAFEDFLYDQMNHGRRALLIVDEAQNLPIHTLEELRVLSNLNYDGTPLFQVFLVGQPDFRDIMARSDMEQLRQRVIASYHLDPMTRAETQKYIEHRLSFVGWSGNPGFSSDAYDAIYAATGGVPRKIHKLCNRILLLCSVEKLAEIDGATVANALSDISTEQAGANADRRADDDLDVEAAFAAARGEAPDDAVPAEETTPAATEIDEIAETIAANVASMAAAEELKARHAEAPVSVLDRLRAKKTAPQQVAAPDETEQAEPPRPATLDDVANAIAAARAGVAHEPRPATEESVETQSDIIEPPPLVEGEGWKKSIVMSIHETRDEVKRAHQSVATLRKQLVEIDKRRKKRRNAIAASLDRAESLLSEFRNTWR